MKITNTMLKKVKACPDQVKLFNKIFPKGAEWPDDMEKASRARLDVEWAAIALKLTGVVKRWYYNGILQREAHFSSGLLSDTTNGIPAYREWYSSGKPKFYDRYKNGEYICGYGK